MFTKIVKSIANHLRVLGWMSIVYLDDWLLLGDTFEHCSENVEITRKTLTSSSFIINKSKIKFVPATRRQFLDFILDSRSFTLALPEEKKQRILNLIHRFTTQRNCRIREFAR